MHPSDLNSMLGLCSGTEPMTVTSIQEMHSLGQKMASTIATMLEKLFEPAEIVITEVNKSEEIRKVATSMKAKNEKPRPVKIIEILKKQGIEVSSPQVSMVLKKMGFHRRKRAKGGAVKTTSVKPSRNAVVTVDDLIAAKRVVSQFGSADKAIAAIQALKHFS